MTSYLAFLYLGRNSRPESTLQTYAMVAILFYVLGYPVSENSLTYYYYYHHHCSFYSPSLLFRIFTITVELLCYKVMKGTEYFVSLQMSVVLIEE
jgi:hypothetical protein